MFDRLTSNRVFYLHFSIAIALIILLLLLFLKALPMTINHVVYFCQQTISGLMISLPHSLPSFFVLGILSVPIVGFISFIIQYYRSRQFVNRLLIHKVNLSKELAKIVSDPSVANRIDVVRSNKLLSFCYGFLHPRICLSTRLISNLKAKELKAVLIHEKYHLKNNDPMKIILGQVIASMFFFIPTIKDINTIFTLSKEISADRLAIKTVGLNALRSSLAKLLTTPKTVKGLAYFNNESYFEERIAFLAFPKRKLLSKLSIKNIIFSVALFIIGSISVNMPVYAIENGQSHEYHICLYEGKCMKSCLQEGMSQEAPFSFEPMFTPLNYSTSDY